MSEPTPEAWALAKALESEDARSWDADFRLAVALSHDRLCEQRASAETERIVDELINTLIAPDTEERDRPGLGLALIKIRAPAERPAPPQQYVQDLHKLDLPRRIGVEQPTQDAGQPGCGTEGRAPDEPLDYIGTEPPPVGYVRLGWACPRDEDLRCSGCDQDDVPPDRCGYGHPAYRSQKWIAWAGRPLPFPSALASTGEQPDSGTTGDLFWFHLHAIRDDDSDDGAQVGPTFDLDDFQLVFDPYNQQIRLNLSAAQVEELKLNPLIMRRIIPPTDAGGLSSTGTEEERQAHG